MAALIAASYAIGGAIRFNIAHGEKLFDAANAGLLMLERVSHVALAFAYFISVTYYLSLLAAFLLKGIGAPDPAGAKLITTAALVFIGGYGFWRGLRGLETLEEYAVGLKLAVIAAVLVALIWFNAADSFKGSWAGWPSAPAFTWHSAKVALGLLIVVQGFETSRFLKGEYAPSLRIRTMRRAQLLAAAIYLVFFALAGVVAHTHIDSHDVAAVTTMLAAVAIVLPLLLVAGAVFAQTSAAIADAIGSAGLLSKSLDGWLTRARAYPIIAARRHCAALDV